MASDSPLNRIADAVEDLAKIAWQNQQVNIWQYEYDKKMGTWTRIHRWTHCQERFIAANPHSINPSHWERIDNGTMPDHQFPEPPAPAGAFAAYPFLGGEIDATKIMRGHFRAQQGVTHDDGKLDPQETAEHEPEQHE